jgi:thiamine transporter
LTWLRGQLFAVDPMNLNQVILAEGKTVKSQTEQQNQKSYKTIFSTKILAEIIIFVAMAGALALISHSFFSLPEGGSINLGMLPIFWLALRRGPKIGIFAGAVLGVVDLAIEPFVVHPIQFILDYPLAFACLGLAGFFRKLNSVGPVLGVVVGGTFRLLCHFTSGVVYFANYAPAGVSVFVYSTVYNATYMIPSIIICAAAIAILQKSKRLNIYQ